MDLFCRWITCQVTCRLTPGYQAEQSLQRQGENRAKSGQSQKVKGQRFVEKKVTATWDYKEFMLVPHSRPDLSSFTVCPLRETAQRGNTCQRKTTGRHQRQQRNKVRDLHDISWPFGRWIAGKMCFRGIHVDHGHPQSWGPQLRFTVKCRNIDQCGNVISDACI